MNNVNFEYKKDPTIKSYNIFLDQMICYASMKKKIMHNESLKEESKKHYQSGIDIKEEK